MIRILGQSKLFPYSQSATNLTILLRLDFWRGNSISTGNSASGFSIKYWLPQCSKVSKHRNNITKTLLWGRRQRTPYLADLSWFWIYAYLVSTHFIANNDSIMKILVDVIGNVSVSLAQVVLTLFQPLLYFIFKKLIHLFIRIFPLLLIDAEYPDYTAFDNTYLYEATVDAMISQRETTSKPHSSLGSNIQKMTKIITWEYGKLVHWYIWKFPTGDCKVGSGVSHPHFCWNRWQSYGLSGNTYFAIIVRQ